MYEVIYSDYYKLHAVKCDTKDKAQEKIKEFKKLIKEEGSGNLYLKYLNSKYDKTKLLVYKPKED